MAGYDLYRSLGLNSAHAPERLAGTIRLLKAQTDASDAARMEELTVAEKILGNPGLKAQYDSRLANPEGPAVTVNDLRQLAGSEAGSRDILAVVRTYAVRAGHLARAYPKAAAGSALGVVVILAVLITGVLAIGGGGEGSDQTGSSGLFGGSSHQRADGLPSFEDQKKDNSVAQPGEEITFVDGDLYTYPDGHSELSKSATKWSISVNNLRLRDVYKPGDSNAPRDHPLSKPSKDGVSVCYDETVKFIEAGSEVSQSSRVVDKYTVSNAANELIVWTWTDRSSWSEPLGSREIWAPGVDKSYVRNQDDPLLDKPQISGNSALFSVCQELEVQSDGSIPSEWIGFKVFPSGSALGERQGAKTQWIFDMPAH
ncbi:hypothetical protein [Corynebacterium heidelbergense]|uniref:Uncharacterized protein n=1 Tax=Corynebacterium heidelbergense TaxID=2055947 RepID=A0A364V5K4_9CORY|nr:hypothetical protein [Corynebacterium heidelbergense]RAV31922.1 hypothetical protein DLJ54_05895 [Corynebacterium heidelbergense]